jgi:transposase
MIQLSANTKYYFYNDVVDMRKGIYGLCGVVENEIKKDMVDRDVFIFLNRKHNTIKLLQWDGDGFSLYEKKLARGTFEHKIQDGQTTILLTHYQLQCVLQGIILQSIRMKRRFVL